MHQVLLDVEPLRVVLLDVGLELPVLVRAVAPAVHSHVVRLERRKDVEVIDELPDPDCDGASLEGEERLEEVRAEGVVLLPYGAEARVESPDLVKTEVLVAVACDDHGRCEDGAGVPHQPPDAGLVVRYVFDGEGFLGDLVLGEDGLHRLVVCQVLDRAGGLHSVLSEESGKLQRVQRPSAGAESRGDEHESPDPRGEVVDPGGRKDCTGALAYHDEAGHVDRLLR